VIHGVRDEKGRFGTTWIWGRLKEMEEGRTKEESLRYGSALQLTRELETTYIQKKRSPSYGKESKRDHATSHALGTVRYQKHSNLQIT